MTERTEHLGDHEPSLRGATSWQWKPIRLPEPIGGVVDGYLSRRRPQFQKAQRLVEAWEMLLPAGLKNQCRLVRFASGTLTVEVTAGPFMHQMQMLSGELIDQLRQRCPRSGLRKIKIVPGRASQE